MSDPRPPAVMDVNRDPGFASICAWCDSKDQADAWARGHGLTPLHGICVACAPKLASDVIFEAGERRAAPVCLAERGTASGGPSRLVDFSCRLGGRVA